MDLLGGATDLSLLAIAGVVLVGLYISYPRLSTIIARLWDKRFPSPPTDGTGDNPDPDNPDIPEPDCIPDGGGKCSSDDDPPVSDTPWTSECMDIMRKGATDAKFRRARTNDWLKECIPLFGPLISGLSQVFGGGTGNPLTDIQQTAKASSFALQAGSAQWENAFSKFIGEESSSINKVVTALLGQDGYIELVAKYSATPLNQAAKLLVPPVLSLLACSFILVWAI